MRHYIGLNPLITETLIRMAPRPWNPHVERLEAAGFPDPWAMYESLLEMDDRLGRSMTRLIDICIEAMDRARQMRERNLVLTPPRFELKAEEPHQIRMPRWSSYDYDSPNKGRAAQRRRDKPWSRG